MFLNAWEPGYSPQFAGWRILPHIYAAERWRLPVGIGFVTELLFRNSHYEENPLRVELRPVIGLDCERWQVVFNPVFERATRGPESLRVELRAGSSSTVEA